MIKESEGKGNELIKLWNKETASLSMTPEQETKAFIVALEFFRRGILLAEKVHGIET